MLLSINEPSPDPSVHVISSTRVSLSVKKCMFSVTLLLGGEDSVVFVSPASLYVIPIWFKAVRLLPSSTDGQPRDWRQRIYTRPLYQLNGNVTHTLSGLRKRVTGGVIQS